MKDLIEKYLSDHKTAWADSTYKSESSRLAKLKEHLGSAPEEVHIALITKGLKPYSIKTNFIRLCSLERWAIDHGHIKEPRFQKYMTKHRNKFKHVYQKEEITITFDEARAKIMTLSDPYQSMALGILETGLRISEVFKVNNGKVIGKGGKPRAIYGNIRITAPRSTFSSYLKSVGLKPHTLRKLWATRLADRGATPQDLCKAAGWTSLNTAYYYLQSRSDQKLKEFVENATKE